MTRQLPDPDGFLERHLKRILGVDMSIKQQISDRILDSQSALLIADENSFEAKYMNGEVNMAELTVAVATAIADGQGATTWEVYQLARYFLHTNGIEAPAFKTPALAASLQGGEAVEYSGKRKVRIESDGHLRADCYTDDDGDYWHDSPEEIEFVSELGLGDTFELSASVRGWQETFKVTKVPDETSDDFEVELVESKAPILTPPAELARDAALVEAYKLGWLTCTNWAARPDLISDIDSPAYITARDVSIAAMGDSNRG